MARPCSYATSKVEEWRSIDLADLRRWRMLDPTMIAKTGRIPAITWNTPHGIDKLGVIAKPGGVLFVRRDDQGQLGNLFVPYVSSPARFGGWRKWFRCPGCGQGCRVLYGVNSLRCRKCRGLKYQSQYERPAFRLLDRARKITAARKRPAIDACSARRRPNTRGNRGGAARGSGLAVQVSCRRTWLHSCGRNSREG
jgi:hypothetical protein